MPEHESYEPLLDDTSLPEVRRRPGGALPEHALWEARVSQENPNTHVGIKTPDDEWFEFHHGEQFALVKNGESRQPIIILPDGQKVSFEKWKGLRQKELQEIAFKSDPYYFRAYMYALLDNPELEQVDIVASTPEQHSVLHHTGGFWERPTESHPNPSIVVNTGGGTEHYERLMLNREGSARRAAELLGLTFDELQAHPNILKMFIFLHEMGHAHDYIVNYAQKSKQLRKDRQEFDPITENKAQRQRELDTLPIPGLNPAAAREYYDSGRLADYYKTYEAYYKKQHIYSAEELLVRQEESYRKLPSEEYADLFAARILFDRLPQSELSPIKAEGTED